MEEFLTFIALFLLLLTAVLLQRKSKRQFSRCVSPEQLKSLLPGELTELDIVDLTDDLIYAELGLGLKEFKSQRAFRYNFERFDGVMFFFDSLQVICLVKGKFIPKKKIIVRLSPGYKSNPEEPFHVSDYRSASGMDLLPKQLLALISDSQFTSTKSFKASKILATSGAMMLAPDYVAITPGELFDLKYSDNAHHLVEFVARCCRALHATTV